MGNTLSASGTSWRPGKQSKNAKRKTAPLDNECTRSLLWVDVSTDTNETVGTIDFMQEKIVWSVEAEDLACNVHDTTHSQQSLWISPIFSVPTSWVSKHCQKFIIAQKWQICTELSLGNGYSGLSIYLRCPSLVQEDQWRQLAACCKFSLEANIVQWPCGKGAGLGQDQAAVASKCSKWLSHCFTSAQPDWGLKDIIPGVQPHVLTGSQLMVHLNFECFAAYLQGDLSGLVLHDTPTIIQISEEPCMLALDRFLTPKQCRVCIIDKNIVELSRPHIKRSKVSAGDETPLRTSSGMFITGALKHHPVFLDLDAKVQHLADMASSLLGRKKLVLSEATQVVRYTEGEYYAEHYDNKAGDCAKRAATIMVYLSDVEGGGHTSFPRSSGFPVIRAMQTRVVRSNNHLAAPPVPHILSTGIAAHQASQTSQQLHGARHLRGNLLPGISIQPKQGRAIVFWSRLSSGKEDRASMHSAEPVLLGEKWITTRWCKEEE